MVTWRVAAPLQLAVSAACLRGLWELCPRIPRILITDRLTGQMSKPLHILRLSPLQAADSKTHEQMLKIEIGKSTMAAVCFQAAISFNSAENWRISAYTNELFHQLETGI